MVEDDIATLFNTVAQDIEPELAAVIGEATRQGRKRRARRRLAIAVTAGFSAGAVAVAATVLVHQAGRSVHGSQVIGPSHRRVHVIKPKAHHARPPVRQESGPGMTPRQMLAVLRPLLPKGQITYVAPYYERGWLEFNFDDGHGAVDIIVDVPPAGEQVACPSPPLRDEGKRPAGAPPISCATSVLPDGETVLRQVTEADFAGYYDVRVDVARPDGVTVSVIVGNGTLEGTPHLGKQGWPWVNRAVPPGSFDTWLTVARSPKWHL